MSIIMFFLILSKNLDIMPFIRKENMERPNIHFYGVASAPNRSPENPLRVVILTSIRDVGHEDRNGLVVSTRNGSRYMEGSTEALVRATSPRGRLHGLIELAGVITDDMPRNLGNSDYPVLPTEGRAWIHPYDMATPEGVLVRDMTKNIESNFRGPKGEHSVAERVLRKRIFEGNVLDQMRQAGGDFILSDHYMAQIDHLYDWLPGRVLNIHPAVTMKEHPFRFVGRTPTADAIAYAVAHEYAWTGATLHHVGPVIDEGPILAFSTATRVYPDDQPQWLRHRNYVTKNSVLIEGLAHYVENVYRHVDYVDRNNYMPVSGPR